MFISVCFHLGINRLYISSWANITTRCFYVVRERKREILSDLAISGQRLCHDGMLDT